MHASKDVFAREPKDLVRIRRGIIEHHLRVCPNVRLVKQKARRQSIKKKAFIIQETASCMMLVSSGKYGTRSGWQT